MTGQDTLVEEGQYPYPDDYVKLVVGVHPTNPGRMRHILTVASKDDVAESVFRNKFYNHVALLVLNLVDVRRHVEQMHDVDERRLGIAKRLLPNHMVAFKGWGGQAIERFIPAWSARTARNKVIPKPFVGTVLRADLLEKLLDKMERAKTGDDAVGFSWDYRDGGDFARYTEKWIASMSPEQRAEFDAQVERQKAYERSLEAERSERSPDDAPA